MALGRGTAAQFRREANSALRLGIIVLRAHWSFFRQARSFWKKRREVRGKAKVSSAEFRRLLGAHSIRARRVAEL